jgi:hypothetical protein
MMTDRFVARPPNGQRVLIFEISWDGGPVDVAVTGLVIRSGDGPGRDVAAWSDFDLRHVHASPPGDPEWLGWGHPREQGRGRGGGGKHMGTVLITGSEQNVAAIAEAVTKAGGEPLTSTESLVKALKDMEEGSLRHYVQMPVSIGLSGATVTGRVRSFLQDGLLARYRTAETLLPYLSDDASVILVSGNFNAESSAPDDRAARLSLVHVLRHSMRADKASPDFQVQVCQVSTDPDEIAHSVVSHQPLPIHHLGEDHPEEAVDPGLGYDDWRIEMLGQMGTEF